LHGYVPGEQPKSKGLIKLNTNENPYPPSPKVLAAIRAATDGRLRLYPNPTAQALREKLAKLHGCSAENIIIGNGSDELLALATRAFVEPLVGQASSLSIPSPMAKAVQTRRADDGTGRMPVLHSSRSTIQYFTPSYSLYPVLAAIHGTRTNAVRLARDFGLPSLDLLEKSRAWDFAAALTFITTPNAPSGRAFATADLDALCRRQRGVVILDEAYVDFAEENALSLASEHPHVLVARTFSKAYSLCFQRVGYFVGHPQLIAALDKLRDSYNVNGLGQIGALATLDHLSYYRANFRRIKATRGRLSEALRTLGFEVLPSQTNFILARPPRFPASEWLEKLRERKILVRWFGGAEVKDYLRITIGTDTEADALLGAARDILKRR
jgi:histidinol-phosphate aminotransferase